MTCNIIKLYLANMYAYIKFGEIISFRSQDIERKPILSICSQDIERKPMFGINRGHNSGKNVRKLTCSNP